MHSCVPRACAAGDCPLQTLFDFTRLHAMQPGESRTVLLSGGAGGTPPACVSATTGHWVVHPGPITVRVGDVVAPASHAMAILGDAPVVVKRNDWAAGLVQ